MEDYRCSKTKFTKNRNSYSKSLIYLLDNILIKDEHNNVNGFYHINSTFLKFCCLVANSCLTLLQPHGLQPTRFLYPWDFPGQNGRMACHFLLEGNLPYPRIESASSALAGEFFTTESPGEPSFFICSSQKTILPVQKYYLRTPMDS